jgi:hypothetical protein
VREIQSRKFAKVLEGSRIVSTGCILSAIEYSKVVNLVVFLNRRKPATSSFIKKCSLVSRGVISLFWAIREILRTSPVAEIVATVVKPIAVFVVNIDIRPSHDLNVHEDATCAVSSIGIPASLSGLKCAPIPLVQPCVISSINDRIETLGKWNKFDRLIERLDNSVSIHAAFHSSYSNRNCAVWPHSSILSERSS